MKPPPQHLRINLDELKAQIVKKLGPEGSKQYFYYLHRFLSLKLSKTEFSKLCLRILGRENIPLHNQFIRSILKNSCGAKAPPTNHHKEAPPTNHHKDDEMLKQATTHHKDDGISANGGCQKNGSHISTAQFSSGLPILPRKSRTILRERRVGGGRRSMLGSNGKTMCLSQPSDFNVAMENGDLIKSNPPPNNMQHHQVLVQQTENGDVGPTPTDISDRRSPIQAPLGVPFCPARRALPLESTLIGTFCDGALLDSCALRERMDHVAVRQGLEGVSMDCANVLNQGLDLYLKALIKSCIDIAGARSSSAENKHHTRMKPLNGVKLCYPHQLQNSIEKIDGLISLQDFRVSMELNPRQLGEDWPLLLEKICTRTFEE